MAQISNWNVLTTDQKIDFLAARLMELQNAVLLKSYASDETLDGVCADDFDRTEDVDWACA